MLIMNLTIRLKFVSNNDWLCACYWQGKMDAAASMIEKAIIACPTYAEAYNNLGISL